MKAWQFFALSSFIWGAPNVSDWLAVSLQFFMFVCALVAMYIERKGIW